MPSISPSTFRRLLSKTLLVICAVFASSPLWAAPGDLDPTFATRGVYSLPPECCAGESGGSAIAVQADGKTLIGGYAQNGTPREAIVLRLTADGRLDAAFGDLGVARISLGEGNGEVRSLVVQPDGRIVAAGVRTQAGTVGHAFVLRLDAAGQLDASFGTGGIALVGPLAEGSTRTSIRRVLLAPDGKLLLVGGLSLADGDTDMFVARLGADGAMDTSFGVGGATLSGLAERDEAYDAALSADGTIHAAGTAILGTTNYGALMRVLANGELDAAFDNDGIKAPIVGFPAELRGIAIQSDGKLLLAGRLNASAATLRVLPSGTLDTTYGNSGAATHTPGSIATRIVMLPGEQTMVLLEDSSSARPQRVNADGTADATFSSSAMPVTGARDGRLADLAQSGTLTTWVAGAIGVRRVDASGALDPSFGSGGLVFASVGLAHPSGELSAVTVTAGGSILFARSVTAGTAVTRLVPSGSLDPTFGTQGVSVLSLSGGPIPGTVGAMRATSDGKTLLSIHTTQSRTVYTRVSRVNADGTLDTAFASPEMVAGSTFYPTGSFITTYPDGRFLFGVPGKVARYLANGTTDPAFNFGQPMSPSGSGWPGWSDAAIAPDARVVLAGREGSNSVYVQRHESDAAVDFSFGNAGRALLTVPESVGTAPRVAVQPDGKVLIATLLQPSSSSDPQAVMVARFTASGALDATFGNNGIVRLIFGTQPNFRGMVLQPDGRIVVTGTEGSSTSGYRAYAVRLNADGTGDASFGSAGIAFVDASSGHESSNDIGLQPNGSIILAGSSNGTPAVFRLFGAESGAGGPAATLIASYYRTILGREADAAGQAFWEGELARVTSLGAGSSETFYVMAMAFFGSAEYAQRNTSDTQFVGDLYRTFFQREPDTAGLDFWTGQLGSGRPREAVLNEFLFSPEFANFMTALFGTANTSRAEVSMVMDFYRGLLHRLPDSGGFDFWAARMRAAQCSGTVAVEADSMSALFLGSEEYANRQAALATAAERNSAFVLDLYSAFMRRGAEAEGLRFYTDQLNAGAQTREQVRRQFVASAEFQARVNAVQSQGCQP